MRRHAARPFTLIELIAVMGVLILLAAVAIPAYSSLFSGRKTTLAANQLNGAVLEGRSHAVSAKVYTALVFVKDKGGNGYDGFRMAEVYHDSDMEASDYVWRRWAPGYSYTRLPDNTMIPASGNSDLGTTNGSNGKVGSGRLPDVKEIPTDDFLKESSAPAIIFKPNGQLAGTGENNVVVRFAESNRYEASPGSAPRLPLNINWLTCKTKFLDPVQ